MLPPTAPVVVVDEDYGGIVADFAARVADYRRHHVVVVVRGPCESACTMVLSLRRTCIEGDDASFGFHRAFYEYADRPGDMSHSAPAATRVMMSHYPVLIRSWIAAHGGLTQRLIRLAGTELRAIVPACRWASDARG